MNFDYDNLSDIDEDQLEAEDFFNRMNNDENANPDYIQKSDSVIFAVDCQKYLFELMNQSKLEEENEEEEDLNLSQIGLILKSLQSFMKSKIVASQNDQVSLILYNVKNDDNALKFQGINRVYSLESPSAERIRDVIKIERQFDEKFAFAETEANLHEVLWLCNSEFQSLDKNKYERRIFLFTGDDNPHSTDEEKRKQAIHHFKSLYDNDIQIELFPLRKKQDQLFDIQRFYVDVLQFDIDEINGSVLDTSSKMMDIATRMRQKEYKKRTLNRLMLSMGNDIQLGTKIYCHISKAKKPNARKIEKNENKPLKTITQKLCTDTGEQLYKEEIGTYFKLNDQKIRITKQEMEKIRSFEKPGITLIGFKPRSKLKLYHNFKHSYFVYPDEQRVKGSGQMFDALIKQMIKKEKIGICRFTSRTSSQVKFCALVPQLESYDRNHIQKPPGFNLVMLPYADDIRSLKSKLPTEHTKVSKELVDITKVLVHKLDILEFDLREFEDPVLQKFYEHLQCHALQEEVPEEVPDLLMPDTEGFERHKDTFDLLKDQLSNEIGQSIDVNEDNKPKKAPQKRVPKADQQKKDIKVTKKDPKKPAPKRGKKKNPNEDNLSDFSHDSRENNKNYEKDGFVVSDNEDDDGDFVMKKEKKKKQPAARKSARQQKKQIVDDDDELDDEDIQNEFAGLDLTQQEKDTIKNDEIEAKIMNYDVEKLTVKDLKEYLKNKDLKTDGTKQTLIDRCLNYVSEKNNQQNKRNSRKKK